MDKRCVVKDCKNTSQEMTFYGGVCAQCYLFLREGVGTSSQIHRNVLVSLLKRLYHAIKGMDSVWTEPEPEPTVVNAKPEIMDVPLAPKAAVKHKPIYTEVKPTTPRQKES